MSKSISKKSKMIAATAFVLGALTVGNVALADAATKTNSMNSLVTAISEKFHLNESDVQAVVNQVMQERQTERKAQMQQTFAERIAKGVSDGKITQAQADLITEKEKEMLAFRESLKDKTAAERQSLMKAKMSELKQWITDNKIPQEFVFSLQSPWGGHPGMKGFKK